MRGWLVKERGWA